MRLKSLLICLFFIISIKGISQHKVGLKFGASLSNSYQNEVFDDTNNLTSVLAGLNYNYFLNEKYHLDADLLYLTRGFNFEIFLRDAEGNQIGVEEAQFNYRYVSIPIKVGRHFGSTLSGYVNVGIVPSILIKATHETPAFLGRPEENLDVTDQVRSLDIGGIVELGGNYNLSDKLTLGLIASYLMSFTSLSTDEYFASDDIKLRSILISAGISYSISNKNND
ncbi:outer membrane beta-barrel protein [Fulvivirga lutea]|uniref:PorT family protein n=1 Tax=Fulvivirga lutea TaxID=2810512 RepID=A0A974WDI3_9BACT|nr:outer membrane beta-barrel protein [Fulvivirga lutea]QSE96074.1 PorT family protein [Fulvivirga lutea]